MDGVSFVDHLFVCLKIIIFIHVFMCHVMSRCRPSDPCVTRDAGVGVVVCAMGESEPSTGRVSLAGRVVVSANGSTMSANPFQRASALFRKSGPVGSSSNSRPGPLEIIDLARDTPSRLIHPSVSKGGKRKKKGHVTQGTMLGFMKKKPSKAVSCEATARTPRLEEYVVQSRIVGCQFHDGKNELRRLKAPECLLVREPNNRFDKNAVLVQGTASGTNIGHIPKAEAAWLSVFLDNRSRGDINITAHVPVSDMAEDEFNKNSFPCVISLHLPLAMQTEGGQFEMAIAEMHASIARSTKQSLKRQRMAEQKQRRIEGPQQQSLFASLKRPSQKHKHGSATDGSLGLSHLPVEILKKVFVSSHVFLSFQDFCHLRMVCKAFCATVIDDPEYVPSFLLFNRLRSRPRFNQNSLAIEHGVAALHETMFINVDRRWGTKVSFSRQDVLDVCKHLPRSIDTSGALYEQWSTSTFLGPAILCAVILQLNGDDMHRVVYTLLHPQAHVCATALSTCCSKIIHGFCERHRLLEFLFSILMPMWIMDPPMDEQMESVSSVPWLACARRTVHDDTDVAVRSKAEQTREFLLSALMVSTECQRSLAFLGGSGSRVLTDEQNDIVTMPLLSQKDDVVAVEAFAGTGKTTTLVEFSRRRPSKRLLYLVFNVSIREHAATLFPPNTDVKSVHAMAFRSVGFRYQHKLKDSLKVSTLMAKKKELVQGQGSVSWFNPEFAAAVISTVENYCNSNMSEMIHLHVPALFSASHVKILAVAKRCFDLMRDRDSSLPMTHSAYLKCYALSRPRLDSMYDIILVDEAQDINPVVQEIVLNQKCAKVFVGDSHQSIYSFSGAQNTLAEVSARASRTFSLTQCFRFGWKLANCSNILLSHWTDEYRRILGSKGAGKLLLPSNDSLTWPESERMHPFKTRVVLNYCIVARKNETLWHIALELLKRMTPFVFVSGVKGYNLTRVINIAKFLNGEKVEGKFFAMFKNPDALYKFAVATEDSEILRSYNTIIEHGADNIIRQFQNIIATSVQYEGKQRVASSDVVSLGTCHKVKGLEFDCVMLANDYVDLMDDEECTGILEAAPGAIDELNMIYVAMTRAKFYLRLSPMLARYMEETGKQLLYEQNSSDVSHLEEH